MTRPLLALTLIATALATGCTLHSGGDDDDSGPVARCGNDIREPGEVCFQAAATSVPLPTIIPGSGLPPATRFADVDGDGDLDAIIPRASILVRLNDGRGVLGD